MKCKHYYNFGININKEIKKGFNQNMWDILRTNSNESSFTIEDNAEDYEKNCENSKAYSDIAQIVVKEIQKTNANKIVSVGVGKGILEWHIKKSRPNLKVDCTDFSELTIEKLKTVWTSCDNIFVFDILKDNWNKLKDYDYIIFYRISTEFDLCTWKSIFCNLAMSGIKNIIFIPTGCDTIGTMIRERINHVINIVFCKKDTFCGWLYSEGEFYKMWKEHYNLVDSIDHENNKIYFLTNR